MDDYADHTLFTHAPHYPTHPVRPEESMTALTYGIPLALKSSSPQDSVDQENYAYNANWMSPPHDLVRSTSLPSPSVEYSLSERGIAGFVAKLYQCLQTSENGQNYARWIRHNGKDMFIIDYIPKFTEEVLPKLFKHCKFPSFVRQLNIYGFQRDTDARKSKDSKDKESCRWYHPYFHPGRRDLFPLIRRKATQYTRRRRAKLLPEDGQDFHASTSFTTSVEPHLSMYDDSTNDTKPTMAADVNPTDLLRPVITDALPCTILSMTDPALSFSSASSTSTIPLDMQETNQLATPSSSSRSSSSFVDNNADYFCSDPPYQHRASMPHLHPPPPGYSLPAAQPQPWLVQDFAYLNQGYPPWMAPSIPPIDRRSSTLLLQHTSSSHDPLDRPVHDDTKSMHAPVTPPLSSSSSIPQSGASTSPLSPAMPSPLVTLPSSPVANGTAFMSSSAPPPYSSTFLPSASAATFSAHRPSHPAPCLSLYDADLLSFQPRIHPPLPP